MPNDFDLAAKERRSLRRWQSFLVAVALVIALIGFGAVLVVADRLDKSNDLARQQRCSFALQGRWNEQIVAYLDAITTGAPPDVRAEIRRNLTRIGQQQASKDVCP